jgi:hypothetical protein
MELEAVDDQGSDQQESAYLGSLGGLVLAPGKVGDGRFPSSVKGIVFFGSISTYYQIDIATLQYPDYDFGHAGDP